MPDDFTVVDAVGTTLEVGMRVRVVGFIPEKHEKIVWYGKVTSISEPDGDVDDYGRSVYIYPRVHVEFDDGDTDNFGTNWTGLWPDDEGEFKCDDIEAL